MPRPFRARVLTPATYTRDLSNGSLDPARYRWHFVAEGDSWMAQSDLFVGALPDFLDLSEEALVVQVARVGDTLRRMDHALGDRQFLGWLDGTTGWRVDGILFSGGGNDLIDACREPDPGEGLLRDCRQGPVPARPEDVVLWDRVARLTTDWLDVHWRAILQAVRASPGGATAPVFLNLYDVPTPRDAPVRSPLGGAGPWLHAAFEKNAVPQPLRGEVTRLLFQALQATLGRWAADPADRVVLVPTNGVLTPADAASTGPDGDWVNEIHPSAQGWEKLAAVWRGVIEGVVG